MTDTEGLKNWGPFSYGTCDFGKLTEWRWLGGKVLCVVFAGMMLAFVPKILKKRGEDYEYKNRRFNSNI